MALTATVTAPSLHRKHFSFLFLRSIIRGATLNLLDGRVRLVRTFAHLRINIRSRIYVSEVEI